MKYDFTSILDRRGMDAIAVDGIGHKIWGNEPAAPKEGFDAIPMWVADMNFATCPAVPAAVMERTKHPLYGYFQPRDEYYQSIINWQTKRNGFTGLKRDYIGYENGVHGCVTSAIQTLSAPGDRILLHSPTYVGFRADVEGLGRTSVYSPLKRDENGVWRMDYEDMDRQLKKYHIHLAIFCSPHNPTGRVWERWELEKAMEVYAANDCFVLSDEIWSDLILPGYHHIPTLSVSDDARRRTAAFYAPSKTFSLAGLIGSYHIIPDPWLRDRVTRQGDLSHYNSCNVLSLHALLGAYSDEGAQWLDELRPVLADNIRYACDFIAAHFPGVQVMQPQGTYMLFLDCAAWLQEHHMTLRELEERGARAGVIWQDGAAFAWPDSIRMNLALPHSRLVEAMERLRVHAFC